MASVTSVRSGLATRLATIAGLNAYATAPGTITTPAAVVLPRQISFDESMNRGSDLMTFDVLVLLGIPTTSLSQDHLDPYLAGSGADSVKAAIEGDGTLGGVADWTRVVGVTQYGDIEYSGNVYLGARFALEVDVDGT